MIESFEIRNTKLIELLDNARKLFTEKYKVSETNNLLGDLNDVAEEWVGPEYRDKIVSLGESHIGYPNNARSYALKPNHYKGGDKQYAKDFNEYDEAIKMELGIAVNALSQLYPPEGFIAWHNNADAPGYNLIFTWSETGDGWFKYIDSDGYEKTIYDTKGWSLKAGYFGTYDESKVCYHAAYTKCWRMTHSFVVSNDKDFWLDCIEHIENDY